MDINEAHENKRANITDDTYVMPHEDQISLETIYNSNLNERLNRIEQQIIDLDKKLTTILETVDSIMNQASPVIKQIADSPMVKMLTGGK